MKRFAVSANIPMELKDKLRVTAEREMCSESTIIRKAIAFYVAQKGYEGNILGNAEQQKE
jgi:predicted transcriptional regulator